MRADVNVSVRKPGGELGTRTETKNVNSVRFVMAVIEHEARRQVEVIEERRRGRPGNAAVRSRQERHALAAVEGRRARLPLFPRSRPAAARARRRVPRRNAARACPNCPTPSASATRALGITPYNAERADRRGRDRALVRRAAARPASSPKQAAQLGASPNCSARSTGSARSIDDSPVSPAQAAELLGAGRRRHDLRHASPSRCSRSCSKPARARPRSSSSEGLKQTSDTGAIDAADRRDPRRQRRQGRAV